MPIGLSVPPRTVPPAARILASARDHPRIDASDAALSGGAAYSCSASAYCHGLSSDFRRGSDRIGLPLTFSRYCTPKNGVLVIDMPDRA
jgi:hypothetical protein